MYLSNAWYVANWSPEIKRALTPLTILGENIVFFRDENNDPVALEVAYCHRKLPLSMGQLFGNRLQCGYHRLEYDASGTCVKMPDADEFQNGREYGLIRWSISGTTCDARDHARSIHRRHHRR